MCSTNKGHFCVLDARDSIVMLYMFTSTGPGVPATHEGNILASADHTSASDMGKNTHHHAQIDDLDSLIDDTVTHSIEVDVDQPDTTSPEPPPTSSPCVTPVNSRGSGGSSPERIVYKRLTQSSRKVDTSIHPAIRVEISRLTRVFMGWIAPDTRLSERNKVELTDTQLQAVLYAREKHVTPVQIANVLGVSVYRVHHILQHAKTMRKRRLVESRKIAPLNGYVAADPPCGQPVGTTAKPPSPSSDPLATHIQKRLLVEDISPRT